MTVPDVTEHLVHYAEPGRKGLVFVGPKGGPLRGANFGRQVWRPAVRSVGLEGLHFHDLRGCAATLAALSGATTAELLARLGHGRVDVAMRYQRATADRDAALARALSDLVARATVVRLAAATEGDRQGVGSTPIPSPTSLHDANGAPWTRGAGEAFVGGEQLASQPLGERDVRRVVRRDVGAEFKGAAHQAECRHSFQLELLEVVDRGGEALGGERVRHPSFTQHGRGLNVDQVRRGDVGGGTEFLASQVPVLAVVREGVGEHGGVNDDQWRERSSPRSSTACRSPTRPPRRDSTRSSTSLMLWRSANRRSSATRYCCRD